MNSGIGIVAKMISFFPYVAVLVDWLLNQFTAALGIQDFPS
jgi:hypothetical protein